MTNFTRPGASSSTVWIAPASTEGWRVNGLVTAGNSVSREVAAAAWPSTTNVSRDSIWLSRIPAPSKPAASMDRSRRMRSGIGAVPGTRRWTRTGWLIARHGIPIRDDDTLRARGRSLDGAHAPSAGIERWSGPGAAGTGADRTGRVGRGRADGGRPRQREEGRVDHHDDGRHRCAGSLSIPGAAPDAR